MILCIDLGNIPSDLCERMLRENTIKLKYLKENLNKVFSYIIESNQNNYGYDIFNFNDENELHFNIYKKNQEYEWHIDSTNEKSSDIKLTVLINVSDSFFSV